MNAIKSLNNNGVHSWYRHDFFFFLIFQQSLSFLFKKSIILCEDFWEINILCYCYKLPTFFPEVSQGVCRGNAPGSWVLTSIKQNKKNANYVISFL